MILKSILVASVCAAPLAYAGSQEREDPIQALHDQYMAESTAGPIEPVEARIAFYESWLSRFRQAIQAHPDSPRVWQARRDMLELLNSLGRKHESLALVEEMLGEAGSGPGRVSLLFHAAGLAEWVSLTEGKDEALARKSMGFLREARALMDEGNAGHVSALRAQADVHSLLLEDHARAAELYMQAYDYRSKVQVDHRSYLEREEELSAEFLLSSAAVEFARGGDVERAMKVFNKLAAIPEARLSRAVYLGDIVLAAGGHGCELICPYIEQWLAERPDFPFPQSAMLRLAGGWKLAGEPEKAIAWYERYLEYSAAHPDTVNQGLFRSALNELSELYKEAGNTARAAELRAEIERLPDPGEAGGQ